MADIASDLLPPTNAHLGKGQQLDAECEVIHWLVHLDTSPLDFELLASHGGRSPDVLTTPSPAIERKR